MRCRLSPASFLLLFLVFALFQKCAVAVGPTMFLTAQNFPVGGSDQRSLAVADLNGDGKPDVVTAISFPDGISVLINNGNGNFQPSVNYTLASGVNSVAVGDFNGDGKLDIVVSGSNISVLLNKGDGTFQAAVSVGPGASYVAVGDFNGDGKLDLVSVDGNTKNVFVLLGKGDGTFQEPLNFSLAGAPTSMAVADFNGDGKLDVAVAHNIRGISYVAVFLGKGDGTLATPVDYLESGRASLFGAMAVGDLNGDGKLDLIVTNGTINLTNENVSVLLGNGDGTFQSPKFTNAVEFPTGVAVGDFDGDGKLDLVVTTYASGDTSILRGKGDGTFQPPVVYVAGGDEPFAPAVGDFNGDRKLDIVTTNLNGSVSELLGNGDATFLAPEKYVVHDLPPLSFVTSVAVGDFNGDGKLDLAVASDNSNSFAGSVSVFLGRGNGSFEAKRTFPAGEGARFVATGDFNGDGKLDIVTADDNGNDVNVLLGNGNGTFQPAVPYAVGSSPYSIAVGDFNRDGKLDLAVANINGNNVSVLLGNGDGTFQAAVNYSVGTGPQSVATGDLNRDGKLDLAVANSGSNNVSDLIGNGDGTFKAAVNYSNGGLFPGEIVVGDLNGDGKPDLAVANDNSEDVSVFLGNGDGTFQSAATYSVHGPSDALAVADFNSDGKLDLATGAPVGDGLGLSVLLGNGDGTFQPVVTYDAGATFGNPIAIGDFNRDGAPDVAMVSSGGVEVLLNTRGTKAHLTSSANPSSFGQSVTFTATVGPTVRGSLRVAGTLTGTVTFRDGTTTLKTVELVSGSASFATSTLSRGTHTITATYSGDSNYNPVTSRPIVQTVQ